VIEVEPAISQSEGIEAEVGKDGDPWPKEGRRSTDFLAVLGRTGSLTRLGRLERNSVGPVVH
jgi:hypothetical protein